MLGSCWLFGVSGDVFLFGKEYVVRLELGICCEPAG
jgi:hypothetical protein